MVPRPEIAHWLAGAISLLVGLLLVSEVLVGSEVFRRRPWRAYLFPAVVIASSVLLWMITIFSTFSTMHLLAHAVWAQAALLAGAVQLALVRGKLVEPRVVARAGSRAPRLGRCLPRTRAERLAVLPIRVSPPRDRLDARRVGTLPARTGAPTTSGRVAGGVRDDLRRAGRAPLRRSGLRADLRPLRGRWAVSRALLLCAVVALLAPNAALGHVILESSQPVTQSRLETPPNEIRLRFNQAVTASPAAIQVLAPDGAVLSGTAATSQEGRVVTVPVSRVVRGVGYTVRWRVIGGDGHAPAGVFTFGVGVAAPPPTEAVGASGATWRDDVARWALFVALALLVGPLVVRLVVVRGPVPARVERGFHLLGVVAAFLVIDVGIVAFVVRASNALQLPLGDLLYGDLAPFAEKTRFGIAFLAMTLGFGIVAAVLLLCLDPRPAGAALARARSLAGARVGSVAVGTPGDGGERRLARAGGGLAPSRRGVGVGGRSRGDRVPACGRSRHPSGAAPSSGSRAWPFCWSERWCWPGRTSRSRGSPRRATSGRRSTVASSC